MRKWGALVDQEQVAPLAAWLAQKYPVAEQPAAPAFMAAADARATVQPQKGQTLRGDVQAGQALFTQSCAACHGPKALGLGGGPSLVENPVVHQRDRFSFLVHHGKGRMPAFDEVTPAQMDSMLTWLANVR